MSTQSSRRRFLASSAATATGLTILTNMKASATQANSKVNVGLVACGGRGNFVADRFHEDGQGQITAAHDYFKDRVDETGSRLAIDSTRRFTGLDGFKKILDLKDIDAVAIESPPYFHPEQVIAALEAGKHVYMAKPVAVDVPGCNAILEASKRHNKLALLVDFQTRTNEFYQGAFKRIVDGMIGVPVCGQAYYHAGRLNPHGKPDNSPMSRLRNWVFDIPLSGDIIVEQNIHVLDVANWYLRANPVKAIGTAGRKVRTDVGNTNDHYVVQYTYPNDVLLDFSSTQFLYGFDDLCCRIYGSLGTADTHYGGTVRVRAKTGGYAGGETKAIYKEGALANVKNFCAALKSGKTLNNIEDSCNSTFTSILGRLAAEEKRSVTWDEMMKANQRIDAKLDLPVNGPDWRPAA